MVSNVFHGNLQGRLDRAQEEPEMGAYCWMGKFVSCRLLKPRH